MAQLADTGCEAAQAASGSEALATLSDAQEAGRPFDLLLIDWKMPQLDGLATVRQLQTLDVTMPRVVLVTAYGREDAAEAVAGLPVEAILTKPILHRELQRVLSGTPHTRNTQVNSGAARGQDALKEVLASLRGARVLLVEDNEDNMELALELLQSNGLEVITASHGKQALEMLETHTVDGVLMDIQMPIMDGYEATRAIRARPDWRELPVIAMTASTLTGDREKAIEAGMQDHISKPIDVDHMFNVLARWIKPARAQAVEEAAQARSADVAAPDIIPPLDGIDTAQGLRRTQNNGVLYRKLLQRFADGQRDFVMRFTAAITAADWTLAQRELHTFKGLAGTIGAVQLHKLSEAMEARCAQMTSDPGEMAQLAAQLELVVMSIDGFLKTADEKALRSSTTDSAPERSNLADLSHVVDTLRRLLPLVEAFDTAALDQLDAQASALSAAGHGTLLKGLKRALAAYDFDTAQTLIQQFLHDNEEKSA
jgi:CheY-like chemotaxis protein